MTPDEFRTLVHTKSDLELLDPCLHSDEAPYVFQTKPQAWDAFRDELASRLGGRRADIRIVGSGRFGFSTKPGRNLRSFSDTSDIDVAIVNADLFDRLWLALLAVAYPRPPIVDKIGGWLKTVRNELYTGWLSPLEIELDVTIFGPKAKPVLDLRTQWFNALKQASQHPPRKHEDVNGRLYRTWRHAELYHLDSISALRKSLEQ